MKVFSTIKSMLVAVCTIVSSTIASAAMVGQEEVRNLMYWDKPIPDIKVDSPARLNDLVINLRPTPKSATDSIGNLLDKDDKLGKTINTYKQKIYQTGNASWYGPRFYGRKTASGEVFTKTQLTAAHRTLPFGTKLRVTNQTTGKSVIVKVNDRGPFHKNRIIDLSHAAASKLGMISDGVCKVTIEKI